MPWPLGEHCVATVAHAGANGACVRASFFLVLALGETCCVWDFVSLAPVAPQSSCFPPYSLEQARQSDMDKSTMDRRSKTKRCGLLL